MEIEEFKLAIVPRTVSYAEACEQHGRIRGVHWVYELDAGPGEPPSADERPKYITWEQFSDLCYGGIVLVAGEGPVFSVCEFRASPELTFYAPFTAFGCLSFSLNADDNALIRVSGARAWLKCADGTLQLVRALIDTDFDHMSDYMPDPIRPVLVHTE